MRLTSFRLILLLCLLCSVGCATRRAEIVRGGVTQNNTLFNPHFTPSSGLESTRSAWPSTLTSNGSGEEIEYSITTTDRQGTYGSDRDHLSRQFRSTRSGRTWR